jgi:spore coat protein U domain-containing protein, fimbrial subunit CupE1/2/3/6
MRNRGFVLRVLLAAGVTCAAAGSAQAQWCWFGTVGGVAFGSYDVFSATPLDSVGSISITCLLAPSPTVSLSPGRSGSFLQRTMVSGANVLNYNLYQDAQRRTIWGDGTGGSSTYGPLNLGFYGTANLSIYGRIPPGQDVAIGAYADTVTVTVNF